MQQGSTQQPACTRQAPGTAASPPLVGTPAGLGLRGPRAAAGQTPPSAHSSQAAGKAAVLRFGPVTSTWWGRRDQGAASDLRPLKPGPPYPPGPAGAPYRQQGGPRGGRVIGVWLLPGEHASQVFPDLPVEHAVQQEHRQALRGGAGSARLGLAQGLVPLRWGCALPSPIAPGKAPWTAAYQASPSTRFSRQEHWSGLPFPSPRHESGK